MEGKFVVRATDDSNEMILPGLDGFFSDVPLMIARRNELIRHAGVSDGLLVCSGYFAVQDLSGWDDPAGSHALKCSFACEDEFAFGFVLGWFGPDGIAFGLVYDHLILIALAG